MTFPRPSFCSLVLGAPLWLGLSLAACSDDDPADLPGTPDAATALPPDAASPLPADAAPATPDADVPAPPDAGPPAPIVLPLSATGHDRFYGVAFGAHDEIYATGHMAVSTDSNADFAFLLAKLTPTGSLDPGFGAGGVAVKNVATGAAGELARGIVVQSTGKIIVSGTIEHAGATDARDRDIALVRFDADGTVDPTFGVDGVVTLDLSTGEAVGTGFVADSVWGLARYPDDRLVVSGAQKRAGATDSDFAIVRLTADGVRDTSFGDNGVTTVDVAGVNASARTATILADGSVLGSGYMNSGGVTRPVVFKLDANGSLDPGFGVGGIFNQPVLAATTECYGAVLQGDKLVTAGYGRNASTESLDFVSLRLDADGTLDPTWGEGGVVRIDVGGFNDNARTLTVLHDQRVLLGGGGRPSENDVDGILAVLTPDGAPDASFAPRGFRAYDFGGPSDFIWSVAEAPSHTHAVGVGIRGATAGGNDDAALVILPL
jgi:uncharacterized delta-60 repeat protein